MYILNYIFNLDNFSEKNYRATLKSNVERHLTNKKCVILDDLNYIKGFRYEMHCRVRQVGTQQATVNKKEKKKLKTLK
jgi:protein KTI12